MTDADYNQDVQNGNWLAAYRAKTSPLATPAIPTHPPTAKIAIIAKNTPATPTPDTFGEFGNFGKTPIGEMGVEGAATGPQPAREDGTAERGIFGNNGYFGRVLSWLCQKSQESQYYQ